MKIVTIIDSFKGSMSSIQAGCAAKQGALRVIKDADVIVMPVADGGEGTVDALTTGFGGEINTVEVTGPLGGKVVAKYGIANNTAIMEMSAAAGIFLVKKEELNPFDATTYGVGEMICDALKKGCRKFIMGIGGSATNDGGVGMLSALGFEFLDENGKPVSLGAKGLSQIAEIRSENVMSEVFEAQFKIACDVNNPLCGSNGCSAIYGPQKGAKPEDIKVLDDAMQSYGKITKKYYPMADVLFSGAGAAGGLGFAFKSYLGAILQPGIELVLEEINAEKHIKDADLIITGEGKMDAQTVMGKVPVGVSKLAKKYNKPVVAFAGGVTRDASECNKHGIDALFPIVRMPCTLESAMDIQTAEQNMADSVEQAIRLFNLRRNYE